MAALADKWADADIDVLAGIAQAPMPFDSAEIMDTPLSWQKKTPNPLLAKLNRESPLFLPYADPEYPCYMTDEEVQFKDEKNRTLFVSVSGPQHFHEAQQMNGRRKRKSIAHRARGSSSKRVRGLSVMAAGQEESRMVVFGIACSPDWDVATCVRQALAQFQKRCKTPIEEDGSEANPEVYTLKITGRADYLLNRDAAIKRYRYIADCIRTGTRAHLSLFKLPTTILENLPPPLPPGGAASAESASFRKMREAEAESLDEQLNAEDDMVLGLDTHSFIQARAAIGCMSSEHKSMKNWPYRLRINGISSSIMPSGTDESKDYLYKSRFYEALELVYVRVEVVYGGEVIYARCTFWKGGERKEVEVDGGRY